MNLSNRVARAVKWSTVFTFLDPLAIFFINVFIYRYLNPEDFGLFAIVNMVLSFMRMAQDLGLNNALVQKKIITEDYYSTAFWSILAVSLLLFGLAYFIAPVVSLFYNNEILTSLITFTSISFLFHGLTSVPRAILTRALDLKRIRTITFIVGIINSTTALILAYLNYQVWSLVLASVFSLFISSILFWINVDWRPSFNFDKAKLKELLNFGIFISGTKLVSYIKKYIDQIIIGKFLGLEILGIYYFAFKAINKPLVIISGMFGNVLLPTFSIIQDNIVKLKSLYMKVINYSSYLIMPAMAIIFILAPNIISFVYGTKWESSVPIIRIICLAGIFESLYNSAVAVKFSLGKPKLIMIINILQTIVYVPLLLFAVKYSLEHIALVATVITFVGFITLQFFINQSLKIKLAEFIKILEKPIIIMLLLILMLGLYETIFSDGIETFIFDLILPLFIAFIAYSIMIIIFSKSILVDAYRLFIKSN